MKNLIKPFLPIALFGVLATSCDKNEMDEMTPATQETTMGNPEAGEEFGESGADSSLAGEAADMGAPEMGGQETGFTENNADTDITPMGTTTARTANGLIYEETMEGANPFATAHEVEKGSMPYGITYVTNPAFKGRKAARFELRETDPLESTGKRVEVTVVKGSEGHITKNTWYSFSQFLPTDYAKDNQPEIINQWFQGNSPATAIRIKNDRYYLHTGNSLSPDNRKYVDLGPVKKGQWTQFVLHFNHSNGPDGLIEVWKDGQKVLTHRGGNMYPGILPKWKVGVYKHAFKNNSSAVDKRVLYYDDIRVGGPNATLAQMMGR
ncbi:polysaccharide lyase [Adhaeribacter soli]|uniref:Polysaccharide lyase n=1 Tax=Adhaeribacter soli TaxID=2607655 RepID=A0A5N1IQA1_9BACT|nr:polysaccharide lyase [Adhaeribacter soli]KAA9325650.1 hypothetical protein F0P94_17085 [Adhaeribacter soli]